jgi:GxxExxY protein
MEKKLTPAVGRKETNKNYPEQQLTEAIIGAAIEVHKCLGPGLLESAYLACMMRELSIRNIQFETERPVPLEYKGVQLGVSYRLDLVVEKKVIVELKSVEKLESIHESQLLTYLRITGIKVGLLINFNVPLLSYGIKRMVL